MFINPMQSIGNISDLQNQDSKATGTTSVQIPFKSFWDDAVNNVKDTDQVLQNETNKLLSGETTNLHDITIASTQASLSLDLAIQLRNKMLDAYNEVMRMGL